MTAVARQMSVREIPLEQLKLHPANPRSDVGDISDLVASIKDLGVLSPLVVSPNGDGWYVIDGSRRLAAAKKAGRATVPVVVRDLDQGEAAAAAIISNIQRLDLSPLEEARAYREWLTITKGTQVELAKKIGRDPSTVSNALRLLEAPKPVQAALADGRITAAHARVALELRDPGSVMKLSLKEGVRVDQIKEQVDRLNADYNFAGPGAVAAAKEALAEIQKKHPKATVVWRALGGYYRDQVVSLPTALGRSPAAIAGGVVDRSYVGVASSKRHAEVCDCSALELIAAVEWRGGRRVLSFTTRPVCIKPANYKKAVQVARSRGGKKTTKKLSPAAAAKRAAELEKRAAEKEKQEQLHAESAVTREFRMVQSGLGKEGAPVVKKIGRSLPADAARAIVLLHLAGESGGLYEPRGIALAWERIVQMPGKKVAALAATAIAHGIVREVARGRTYRDEGTDHLLNGVRSHFGLKVREPKKKAKR